MEWWEFFLVMIVVMPIVVMWVACLIDIIGRPDISGWAKAGWMLGVLFFPLVGSDHLRDHEAGAGPGHASL